jgi:hypothetical protein
LIYLVSRFAENELNEDEEQYDEEDDDKEEEVINNLHTVRRESIQISYLIFMFFFYFISF